MRLRIEEEIDQRLPPDFGPRSKNKKDQGDFKVTVTVTGMTPVHEAALNAKMMADKSYPNWFMLTRRSRPEIRSFKTARSAMNHVDHLLKSSQTPWSGLRGCRVTYSVERTGEVMLFFQVTYWSPGLPYDGRVTNVFDGALLAKGGFHGGEDMARNLSRTKDWCSVVIHRSLEKPFSDFKLEDHLFLYDTVCSIIHLETLQEKP